jgi:hypothetical protein
LDGPLAGLMETTMSTNDTSYGVAATSERELTIDKLDDVSGAIDTFFHALLRPAPLARSGALGGSNQAAAPHSLRPETVS